MSTELISRFRGYTESFKKFFVDREDEVDSLFYAILTKEHLLLRGTPGTGKSMLAKSFFHGIEGSRIFNIQMTAFMDESYIFGPQDIERLKKGEVVHNIEGSLADCDFAFLDEAFNASDETLSSMNEVLNERSFTRSKQFKKCDLVTAVMTTNQDRTDEEKVKPIYDRILFNREVKKLTPECRRILYLNYLNKKDKFAERFSFEDLKKIHEYIEKTEVDFPDSILEAFNKLIDIFAKKTEIDLSDRRILKCLELLKCRALACGRKDVNIDDLYKLKLVLTSSENTELVFDEVFVILRKEYAVVVAQASEFNRFKKMVLNTLACDTQDISMKDRILNDLGSTTQLFAQGVSAKDRAKVTKTIKDYLKLEQKDKLAFTKTLVEKSGSELKISDILRELEVNPFSKDMDKDNAVFKSLGDEMTEKELINISNTGTSKEVSLFQPKKETSIEDYEKKIEEYSKEVKTNVSDLLDTWRKEQ